LLCLAIATPPWGRKLLGDEAETISASI